MIHYLKEAGLFAWVKRYVQVEGIPIPRLLLAFGVMLVSASRVERREWRWD